jgi:hypothetical protein
MRSFLLIAAAVLSFAATMTFETTDANTVVCARGVYRAGLRRVSRCGRRAQAGGRGLPLGVGGRRESSSLLLT